VEAGLIESGALIASVVVEDCVVIKENLISSIPEVLLYTLSGI
jgi:hypothetical protein